MEFAEVRALETSVQALCDRFDPDAVPIHEVEGAYDSLCRTEKLIAGAKLRLARRLEETGSWERKGHPSPAHLIAKKEGTGIGAAKTELATSKRLAELPATDDAVREGKVSTRQAAVVADAASAAPAKEREMLAAAQQESLGELIQHGERVKAAADRDAEARRDRVRAARHARHRATCDGGGEIVYRSSLDETTEAWAVFQGFANAEFRKARTDGRRDDPEVYAADGVLAAARAAAGRASAPAAGARPTRAPVPVKIIVRTDWDVLVRGFPIDGEVCEIAGAGPVPVSVVRELIDSGNAVLAAVATKGVDVAHLGRRVTAHQLTALEWRDPSCQATGCNRVANLEKDHRLDWADTKITLVSLMDRLCDFHHDLKTYRGWRLVEGTGKRLMVDPGDPRHPDNAASHDDATAGTRRPRPTGQRRVSGAHAVGRTPVRDRAQSPGALPVRGPGPPRSAHV